MVVRVFDLFKSHNDFYRTSPTILNHTKEKTSLKSLPKGPIFPTLIYRYGQTMYVSLIFSKTIFHHVSHISIFKLTCEKGCRFYKAYLVNTNFEGSDLRGASLEDTSMDGSNLKNAIVSGAYFSASLLDVATAEGADFTDAQIPVKTLTSFCEKKDIVKGKNPVTGVDTRESLMCLD
jgi:uncharacterized protein YjbI with pentapeptide repeats